MHSYMLDIERNISRGYSNIEKFLVEFQDVFNVYYRSIINQLDQLYDNKIKDRFKVLQKLSKYFKYSQYYCKVVLLNDIELGLFKVDCQNIQKKVQQYMLQLQGDNNKIIQETVRRRVQEISQYYDLYYIGLQKIVTKVEDYVDQVMIINGYQLN